jgi:peptidoglycan/LPS O-acetylase OafA/YrhL
MTATVGVAPAGHLSYRADIDGLRAVSILLVVAFHAGIARFPGGYVGVDVFFVLSGYLITGLLLKEHDTHGRVRLAEFYARRARRLLPMAALVLSLTTVAGLWLLPPLSRVELLRDARAAALYVANWRYSVQATAYSDAEVTDSLLLHYWSLSVEEQYYVLWPLLIVAAGWLVTRIARLRFRPTLLGMLGAVVAGSLAASLLLTERLGPAAYYATHTRLWEMGIGALLAFTVPGLHRLPRWAAESLSVAGVTAIVVAAMSYSAESAFPGWLALVPVLGTAAVIIGGHGGTTALSSLLSLRPMTALGRWSYGWYLWHWPAIGLALLWNEQQAAPLARSAVIAAAVVGSLILAIGSYKLVETPLRYAAWLRRGVRPSLAMGATLTLAPVALIGVALLAGTSLGGAAVTVAESEPGAEDVTLASARGWELGLPQAPMTPAEAVEDRGDLGRPSCHVAQPDTAPASPQDCTFGDPDGTSVVVLTGDSHAHHWLPALDIIGKERGFAVLLASKSACTPIDVPIWSGSFSRPYSECAEWRAASLDVARSLDRPVGMVVIARSRGYRDILLDEDGQRLDDLAEATALWQEGSHRTLEAWSEITPNIVVLRDTPRARHDVPTCLSEHPSDPERCSLDLATDWGSDAWQYFGEWSAGQDLDVEIAFVDPTPLVCSAHACRMITDTGIIKFRDRHHLTAAFARSLAPGLDGLLPRVPPTP